MPANGRNLGFGRKETPIGGVQQARFASFVSECRADDAIAQATATWVIDVLGDLGLESGARGNRKQTGELDRCDFVYEVDGQVRSLLGPPYYAQKRQTEGSNREE